MSTKAFIWGTKHDSHTKILKSRLEHRRAQFQFNLRSRSKTTITFFTELGLRRFKRNLKYNSLIYPQTKNTILNGSINSSFPVKLLFQFSSQFQCILHSLEEIGHTFVHTTQN